MRMTIGEIKQQFAQIVQEAFDKSELVKVVEANLSYAKTLTEQEKYYDDQLRTLGKKIDNAWLENNRLTAELKKQSPSMDQKARTLLFETCVSLGGSPLSDYEAVQFLVGQLEFFRQVDKFAVGELVFIAVGSEIHQTRIRAITANMIAPDLTYRRTVTVRIDLPSPVTLDVLFDESDVYKTAEECRRKIKVREHNDRTK